ncbi:HOOK protein-domain-containing protein [Dichotomocladium elegans]|nr:HOOK protein-domain-containing protein [Dichotomocladium elegans]
MTFSRMEAALEDAFIEWINTFDGKSCPIDTIVELIDGVILSEVLIDIDPKWFKQLSKSSAEANAVKRNSINSNGSDSNNGGDSAWVMRLNNQKKIHKLITRYFEEVLGQDPELLPAIDLNAIAKGANHHDLLLMCQLVVAIAVQSDNNRMYIDMIQSLSQKSQHALMLSIEEVMNNFNGDIDNHRNSQLSGNSGSTSQRSFFLDGDMPYRYQIEFDRIISDKKLIENTHNQLMEDYEELRDRFDELLNEKKEMQARLRDMEEAIAQTSTTGKADFVMRTEIEHLKQDLERCEEQRLEVDNLAETQRSSINELRRKVDELTVKADEAEVLRAELEEYREALERMASLEITLEKYEREAQERMDLEDQIKALEQQNTDLLKRSHEAEDEYRKLLRFKTIMGSFEEQVQQLAASNRELMEEKNRLEEENRTMTQTCQYLEQERDSNMEQVQFLEEQIKELELSGGTSIEKAINHRASVVIDEDIDADMEENMKKANVTELRLNIQRLKNQIKEMEKAKGISDGTSQDGKENVSTKEQFGNEDYAAIVKERDQLRQELAQIRNGIPDSLLNETQTVMAFRSRILDLEKESKLLKEWTSKLEATVLQGTRSVAKDSDSLKTYEAEHARIQERLNRLEDITKMQLHDINRMLVEANYLHGVNSDGSLKDRPQLTDEDLEKIKEQNANLQICVLHLQEEINESQSKIRKARDMIKLYSQLLEEMNARFNSVRQFEEPNPHSRTPRTKEEEHDLLKKQIHDVRVQSRREQQLIISAWYDLARRNHREVINLSIRSTPSSWLGQQRKILDSQLRKRLC